MIKNISHFQVVTCAATGRTDRVLVTRGHINVQQFRALVARLTPVHGFGTLRSDTPITVTDKFGNVVALISADSCSV